jgi:hypothetical protein
MTSAYIDEGSSFSGYETAEDHGPKEDDQPLANRDGKVWAVLNGVMCNHPAVGMTTR